MKRTVSSEDIVPEKEQRLSLEQYLENVLEKGIIGHSAKLIWLDPSDERIPFSGFFWDCFDSVVSDANHHEGDDYKDMLYELRLQREKLATMTDEKKLALLESFVMWENVVIDFHAIEIGMKNTVMQQLSEWENSGLMNGPPYKISPEEAMSQIELILHQDYDLTHPDSLAASKALDEIGKLAIFAGRAYKKTRTHE